MQNQMDCNIGPIEIHWTLYMFLERPTFRLQLTLVPQIKKMEILFGERRKEKKNK